MIEYDEIEVCPQCQEQYTCDDAYQETPDGYVCSKECFDNWESSQEIPLAVQ